MVKKEINSSISCEILQKILASEYVFYTKIRNYHWNVKGPNFNDLHLFFDKQYEIFDIVIDDIAERINQLDGFADATLENFLKNSLVSEGEDKLDCSQMVKHLLSDCDKIISLLNDSIKKTDKFNDFGSVEFLTSVLQKHEKLHWQLSAMSSK
jgi:starvation-inducible DNA-binding protein